MIHEAILGPDLHLGLILSVGPAPEPMLTYQTPSLVSSMYVCDQVAVPLAHYRLYRLTRALIYHPVLLVQVYIILLFRRDRYEKAIIWISGISSECILNEHCECLI